MSRLHKVDPSTITSTPTFTIVSRFPDGNPFTVTRASDGETFGIEDLVSSGTKMKGRITGFEVYMEEDTHALTMFINHTWSKVGMGIEDIHKLPVLPCEYQFGDAILVYFVPDAELVKLIALSPVPESYTCIVNKLFKDGKMEPVQAERKGIRGRIHAVHFTPGKIKYDIDLSFTGGANTRIYNIDSIFVFPDKS